MGFYGDLMFGRVEMRFYCSELSERKLAVISCLAKYIKRQVEEYRHEKDGWDRLLSDLEELIELADTGLGTSLINKLYRTASF